MKIIKQLIAWFAGGGALLLLSGFLLAAPAAQAQAGDAPASSRGEVSNAVLEERINSTNIRIDSLEKSLNARIDSLERSIQMLMWVVGSIFALLTLLVALLPHYFASLQRQMSSMQEQISRLAPPDGSATGRQAGGVPSAEASRSTSSQAIEHAAIADRKAKYKARQPGAKSR